MDIVKVTTYIMKNKVRVSQNKNSTIQTSILKLYPTQAKISDCYGSQHYTRIIHTDEHISDLGKTPG